MEKIFFISMDALFPTLFWGNLMSSLFLLIYYAQNKPDKEKRLLQFLFFARFCYAFHYYVGTGRGILPDWLSVNLGITLLFIGCFFEANALLRITNENSKFTDRLLAVLLVLSIIAFNVVESRLHSSGLRITMASLGNIVFMILPVLRILHNKNTSAFAKSIALFYSLFMVGLLCRAVYGFADQSISILTNNAVQSITFLSLLLQLIISLPAYALILKGYADEELERMAKTDKLTGATNRHAFLSAASIIFENSQRYNNPIAVLFIDIDHFKQVNDRHGHAFGDIVLIRLVKIIEKSLRSSDLNCRYGGEEFVALLSHGDHSAAESVSRRIMNEVRKARFSEKPDFNFTVSIGIYSALTLADQTFESFVDKADEALYKAKANGRNCAVFYDLP